MALTKSPAGVPWNVGIEQLNAEETRIYTDRLVEEWAQESQRMDFLRACGLSDDNMKGALKVIALGVWQFVGEELLAAHPASNFSVRDLARMNARTYNLSRQVDIGWWREFASGIAVRVFKAKGPTA